VVNIITPAIPSCFLAFFNDPYSLFEKKKFINLVNMKIRIKWQISVLGDIHVMLPFYLILTREPIIIVKKYLKAILN